MKRMAVFLSGSGTTLANFFKKVDESKLEDKTERQQYDLLIPFKKELSDLGIRSEFTDADDTLYNFVGTKPEYNRRA